MPQNQLIVLPIAISRVYLSQKYEVAEVFDLYYRFPWKPNFSVKIYTKLQKNLKEEQPVL